MYLKSLFLIIFAAISIISCGEGVVGVNENNYEPKIVIQGYLFPEQEVKNIRISRNFPLNLEVNTTQLIIRDANVSITDLENNLSYDLVHDLNFNSYEYRGNDLEIQCGKSYRLDVTAKIDGVEFSAHSTTTVPQQGFEIDETESMLESIGYRERDENNNLKFINIVFKRSKGLNFYPYSIVALDADTSTFNYDNPYFSTEPDSIVDDIYNLQYEGNSVFNTPTDEGFSNIEILWEDLWFFSKYRAIVYAADKNFKDFWLTHDNLFDIDGNLNEPAFHIEGDGIGVFGSAIADTVYFEITRN